MLIILMKHGLCMYPTSEGLKKNPSDVRLQRVTICDAIPWFKNSMTFLSVVLMFICMIPILIQIGSIYPSEPESLPEL
jgi:hypothetical protein